MLSPSMPSALQIGGITVSKVGRVQSIIRFVVRLIVCRVLLRWRLTSVSVHRLAALRTGCAFGRPKLLLCIVHGKLGQVRSAAG